MKARLWPVLCVMLLPGLAPAVWSGEQPGVPEGPWYPFPELPAVLYYQDLESGPGALLSGKVVDAPGGSGGKAWLLAEEMVSTNLGPRRAGLATLSLKQTKARVPYGNKPNQIIFYFSIWADEPGDLLLRFHGKDVHQARTGVSTPKKWTALSIPFSELAHLSITEIITQVDIYFFSRASAAFPKAYLNELLITNGVPRVASVLPAAQRARKQARELEKTTAKDGFTFDPQNLDTLRKALSIGTNRKKQKSVLVVGPRPGDGPALAQALTDAAPKIKLAGYIFLPAQAPDNSPVGGLEDMRTLLKCNLDRNPALFVLLVLGYKDVSTGDAPAESMRVVLERALAAGCIPLVSLPPPLAPLAPADKTKAESFVNAVRNICAPKGITIIEASNALRDLANPLSEGELSAAGLEGVAGVGAAALKHLDTNLLGHK